MCRLNDSRVAPDRLPLSFICVYLFIFIIIWGAGGSLAGN